MSSKSVLVVPWLVVQIGLGAVVPALAAGDDRVQLKSWIDGPIRYIASKDEARTFRGLNSDDQRAYFIERFWNRRDPSPETLTNEYRQLFWERVSYANNTFIDSPKGGWRTDRGKVYILYGEPTEIQEDIYLETESTPTSGSGLIRWIYEGRPGERMDLNPIVVVPFVRDVGGEYRLSYDPLLASVFFDANYFREDEFDRVERYSAFNAGSKTNRSQLSVMLDLGKMQEVPPQEQVFLESVETTEAYRTEPVGLALQRYRHPDRGGSLVVLNIDLSSMDAENKPAIIARFTPEPGPGQPRILGEDSFRLERRGGLPLAQGRIVLDPGQYTMTLMVVNPLDARTGLIRREIDVPDTSTRLRFSDVVWAESLEPLPYASLVSYDEPFVVGTFRVLPRIGSTFQPGDTVRLFYEVYNAEFPIRVSYRLQGREQDGRWVDLGRPSSAEQATPTQGWELPTSPQWPAGEYRVRIEVRDSGDRLISVDQEFTLAEGDTAEPAS